MTWLVPVSRGCLLGRVGLDCGLELGPLGVLLVAVAAAALVVGLASAVPPSTVTGLGAGLCLLAFGLATLLIRGPGQGTPSTQT